MISVFVVTSELQFFNTLNIDDDNEKYLLFLNSFSGAKDFFSNIDVNKILWHKKLIFSELTSIFEWIITNKKNIQNVYLDSDIGNRRFFRKMSRLNLIVYEEGVGTYRKRQYKPRTFWGHIYMYFLQMRGYRNRRAGNKYVKNILVYNPLFLENYWKDNSLTYSSFKLPFFDHLNNVIDIEQSMIDFNIDKFANKSVLIYLTSWRLNPNAIKLCSQIDSEIRIIKTHPKLKEDISSINIFNFQINASMMAEFLIWKVLKVTKKLIVISEYSSSVIYFYGQKGIEIINLEPNSVDPKNDFDSYKEGFLSLKNYLNS